MLNPIKLITDEETRLKGIYFIDKTGLAVVGISAVMISAMYLHVDLGAIALGITIIAGIVGFQLGKVNEQVKSL